MSKKYFAKCKTAGDVMMAFYNGIKEISGAEAEAFWADGRKAWDKFHDYRRSLKGSIYSEAGSNPASADEVFVALSRLAIVNVKPIFKGDWIWVNTKSAKAAAQLREAGFWKKTGKDSYYFNVKAYKNLLNAKANSQNKPAKKSA